MSKEFNKILNENLERQRRKENWIEEKLKTVLPKEEDLKDISKVMLAHNIVVLQDQLDEMTDERDIISSENTRLLEEVDNLKVLLKNVKV